MKLRSLLTGLAVLLLSTTVAHATTYYVAASGGNNGNSCGAAQSVSTPKLTITAGLACMSGGDTLNVRQGTYSEDVFLNVPSGISNTQRTIIQGYAGDPRPTMKWSLTLALENNITWSGINIDGSGSSNDTADCVLINSGSNITITNAELVNCQRHGIDTGDGNGAKLDNLVFSFLNIHNEGQGYLTSPDPRHHGLYIAASAFTTGPILIDHVESHNEGNPANAASGGPSGSAANSWGIQIYAAVNGFLNQVTVQNSYIHDNNQGIVVGSGSNHKIINNVIYNNDLPTSFGESAICVCYGTGNNIQVYNNTIVGNSSFGAYGISVNQSFGAMTNTIIKNNILYQNGHDSIFVGPNASGTVQSNNWLASDPQFVSLATKDFHLQPTSVAHNTGANLYSIFTTDKDGNPRPASGSWDPGAYAIISAPAPPPPPPPVITNACTCIMQGGNAVTTCSNNTTVAVTVSTSLSVCK